MCGIFFSLSSHEHVVADPVTEQLLQNRGPDKTGNHKTLISSRASHPLYATFYSTVLSLRGSIVVEQPLQDPNTNSTLCWNGEAWTISGESVQGNDSRAVFNTLLEAITPKTDLSRTSSIESVVQSLSSIRGPFAFVFFDATNHILYYGRDCLGRRSLLRKSTSDNVIILSSVCDNSTGNHWAEVEADGIYVIDLQDPSPEGIPNVVHIPHRRSGEEKLGDTAFVGKSSHRIHELIIVDVAIPCP